MAKALSRGAVHDGFFGRNGLTIAFVVLMALSLVGHVLTGWHVANQDRGSHGEPAQRLSEYLVDPSFLSSLFENWESEFLQMGLFVLFTAFLRQRGASESRPLDPSEEKPPRPTAVGDRPLPVRMGGVARKVYEHSLSGALLLMFVLSFFAHLYNSWRDHVEKATQHGQKIAGSMWSYLGDAGFWFESFQNWQSEFLAVISLVVLSIFLREKDSTESKDVEASNSQTGD